MLATFKRAALAAVAVGAAAVAGAANRRTPAAELIKIDGSSTVYPITEAVAEEFGAEHKGQVARDRRHLRHRRRASRSSSAARPTSRTPRARSSKRRWPTPKSNGIEYIELPIAFDALTVVVNPANTGSTTSRSRS